ncbi:transferase, partial [Streptomyces sp. SID4985]|nr:transferase [Streptomyces sp. SID4985]
MVRARAARGFRLPVRRPPARAASPLPLLAADLAGALVGAAALDPAAHHPLLIAALLCGALLLRPR